MRQGQRYGSSKRVLKVTMVGPSPGSLLLLSVEVESGDKSLVNALSHSLFLRDQLLKEIADLRKDVALLTPGRALPPSRVEEHYIEPESQYEQREIEAQQARIKAEWKRLEEDKKRGKERERGIDEREREVAQREQWVLDEMR